MKTFAELDRLNAEKHLKIVIPSDPADNAAELSWAKLHDERSTTRKAAGKLLDLAKKDNRDLTEEEERAFDAAMSYADVLNDEFDRREVSGQKEPTGGDKPHRPSFSSKKGDASMNENMFAPRKRWSEIHGREPRKVEGFKNFGECIQALHNGEEEKLRELRTMNATTGSEGGFSVPEIMWSKIYDSSVEASVTLDLVTNLPMGSDTLYVPAWESADKTQGPIGCVKGTWIGEAETATRVTPKLRLVSYFARKLGLYIACSSEVLQDSIALSQSLGPLMRNSLAFSLDDVVLNGDGTSKPTGILNSPAAVNLGRTTANTIVFGDLTGMMGRMIPNSLERCVWMCSPSAFNTLLAMVTSAGSGELVLGFQPGASDIKMQILGRPLRVTEKLPSMGTKGDLILADLSYYGLAQRETARFEKTNAAQWTSDVLDFRLILRVDGKPLISQPFTPAGGGSTLSPFVVLDA